MFLMFVVKGIVNDFAPLDRDTKDYNNYFPSLSDSAFAFFVDPLQNENG
jgi:hypothetical protein